MTGIWPGSVVFSRPVHLPRRPAKRWPQFTPSSRRNSRLDELVQEALSANRNLAAADAHLNAARAVLSEAHAQRYPSTSVVASGIYGRNAITDEILELGGRPPETIWLFEDLIQVAYEVDLFDRLCMDPREIDTPCRG